MRTIELRSGEPVPAIGQTTWGYGEDPARRSEEVATLREGLELGMTLVDTAELYADGAAEELVGEAIAGRRDDVFLVGKVLPAHATVEGTVTACRRRTGSEALVSRENDPHLIPVSPLGQHLREQKREISWAFLNRGDRI
jgi:diketogulonate reductase-like aldo/keto reductase